MGGVERETSVEETLREERAERNGESGRSKRNPAKRDVCTWGSSIWLPGRRAGFCEAPLIRPSVLCCSAGVREEARFEVLKKGLVVNSADSFVLGAWKVQGFERYSGWCSGHQASICSATNGHYLRISGTR